MHFVQNFNFDIKGNSLIAFNVITDFKVFISYD